MLFSGLMRSTIFLILVWAASSTLLRFESVAVSSAAHLLRTLYGWAIVAIVISVARQLLRRRPATGESALPQILSAFSAFLVFALLLSGLVAVSATLSLSAAVPAFAGGVVAPVITLMILESHTLRPRGFTAGLIALACLSCFALTITLVRKPSAPGPVRIEHPVKGLQHHQPQAPSVA